jgi:phage FluMu protein Com
MLSPDLSEYRCPCGKLLFKSPLFWGRIEIKCRRCRDVKVFEIASAKLG